MLRQREQGIRKKLPSFSVDKLIGTCVDDFHVNPMHQRGLLKDLTSPFKTNLKISNESSEVRGPIEM